MKIFLNTHLKIKLTQKILIYKKGYLIYLQTILICWFGAQETFLIIIYIIIVLLNAFVEICFYYYSSFNFF